jgi:membrane protein YdbS with pleckstrin-like domain
MQTKDIQLRPAATYAFMKCLPLIILSALFLLLSLKLSPYFIFFSVTVTIIALYRYAFIRRITYVLCEQYIRIHNGIFFKRTDQVELYRVKDYIVTQPPMMQLFRLMNVILKTTDRENTVITMTGIPESELVDEIRDRVQAARKNNQIYEIN